MNLKYNFIMKKNHLIIMISLLAFVGCNSNKTNMENVILEESQTDDYAILTKPENPSHRIAENLSGKAIVITEKDFIERITAIDNPKGFQYLGQTPCIVEFYADWCRPCAYQSQVFNVLAPEYQGKVIFYRLNIEKAVDVRTAFKVDDIPVILYFKPHKGVSKTIGYLNKEKLQQTIADLLLEP
jgi:thioredoxin-like negative regulator of GroEL